MARAIHGYDPLQDEAKETGVPYVTLLQLWIFKEIKKRADQAGMET